MVRALILTLRQLGDPAIVGVILRSLALTLLVFAASGVALGLGGRMLLAHAGIGHAGAIAATAATLLTILTGWLLFRAVAVAVIGLFADTIVAAVEQRHYPAEAARARPVRLHRALAMGGRSAARAILANLVAAPFYLLLLVSAVGAPLAPLLFAAVNAPLLGRDLGEMVAARHVPAAAMKGWLAATRGPRALIGLVATLLFVIPVVNLLAPAIGAALATHRFHGGRQ